MLDGSKARKKDRRRKASKREAVTLQDRQPRGGDDAAVCVTLNKGKAKDVAKRTKSETSNTAKRDGLPKSSRKAKAGNGDDKSSRLQLIASKELTHY